jgi:glycosyltransferase involved in cell wall biosynthesis
MTKITALIITLNEERHIAACIAAVRDICEEVLVIDDMSSDRTREIAAAAGAGVIPHVFEGFGAQKNFGTMSAAHDLILSIDADEIVSEELKKSILAVKERHHAAAYSFNILNFVGSRAVRTCGWYPDTHVRLYDRRTVRWNDRTVHEGLIIEGKVHFLTGDIQHYSYDDIAGIKAKSSRYARLGAAVYQGRGAAFLYAKMLVNPPAKFIKVYLLQLGFMDGYLGLMISYYRARETFLKYYWALT